MKIKSAELACVCGPTSKFPIYDMPEVAFAGRSNVGKSSLINSLLCRKNLARTSSSPGKTVTINFYNVNNEFFLVDLPGYGYAKASDTERARWGKMIEKYLNNRANLTMVILLVDIRHAPSKDDVLMYDWISKSGLNTFVVATNLDKIKRSQIDKQKKLIRETLGMKSSENIYTFSSLSKQGREELLKCMSEQMGLGVTE